MKPVYQTALTPPDGDCVRASLASCLELPLEAVPHFRGDKWEEAANFWLAENYGLGLVPITINAEKFPVGVGYHLIDGPSHSGNWNHVVVGWRGQVAHDPNPSSGGPRKVDALYLFVVLDPALLLLKRKAQAHDEMVAEIERLRGPCGKCNVQGLVLNEAKRLLRALLVEAPNTKTHREAEMFLRMGERKVRAALAERERE